MTPATAPPLMTVEEFADRYAGERNIELIDGRPRKLPMPHAEHGWVSGNLALPLLNHVKAAGCGRVFLNDTFVRVGGEIERVRGADAAYLSYARLPREAAVPKVLVAPDLVFEVKSPSDRLGEVLTKVGEYLSSGVGAVVVLDPDLKMAAVFRPDELPVRLHNGDELTLPDVLPGFAVPVKAFFE
jgi:Uma2 family endonuclease